MSGAMKVALITGASRGIGRAVALELARAGFIAALNARMDRPGIHQVRDEILQAGGKALLCPFDVSDRDAVEAEVKALARREGGIGALVNNAGIIRDQPLVRMRDTDWDLVLATNLTGVYNCSKAVLKTWAGRKLDRRIVNISSVCGETGNAYQSNYAASKGGIISFSKALARELAPKRITVNVVAPGFIATDQIAHLPVDRLCRDIPLGRKGTPEEVAHAVGFLVSEQAGYITGQVIRVNGGLYM